MYGLCLSICKHIQPQKKQMTRLGEENMRCPHSHDECLSRCVLASVCPFSVSVCVVPFKLFYTAEPQLVYRPISVRSKQPTDTQNDPAAVVATLSGRPAVSIMTGLDSEGGGAGEGGGAKNSADCVVLQDWLTRIAHSPISPGSPYTHDVEKGGESETTFSTARHGETPTLQDNYNPGLVRPDSAAKRAACRSNLQR